MNIGTEFRRIAAALRALPRQERIRLGQLGGVSLTTIQNVALGYRPDPRISTLESLSAALEKYEKFMARHNAQ